MAEFVAKYGDKAGTKVVYRDSLTMGQVWEISKMAKGQNAEKDSAIQLFRLSVMKVVTPDNVEHTASVEMTKLFDELDARDGLKLTQILTKLITGDGDDPKES